jgi:diguanylate cyclase (GGDEF)-like protein
MIIILSFHLGKLFPMPQYANTLIRLGLYVFVIVLFQRHLLTVYRSILSNWPVFSLLVVCIFLNLSYYFYVTDDIQNTLSMFKWPLYLLVMLSVAAYGTVFYALKQFAMIYALEAENMKFQHDTGLLYEAAMKLEKIANYDTLTGLPNRRYFFERLEKVTEESTKHSRNAAIVFIDLDGFKAINDTFGHEIGDGVLTTVGDRLMKCLRKTDFVARIGGDEFAIIIEDIEEMKHAENLAHKIHTQLQEIMYIDNVECSVNASIGIALYPESGSTGEILLRNADFAMYEIKRQGKGGIGVYTNAMR